MRKTYICKPQLQEESKALASAAVASFRAVCDDGNSKQVQFEPHRAVVQSPALSLAPSGPSPSVLASGSDAGAAIAQRKKEGGFIGYGKK